jgi:hypothetical protein
LGLAKVKLDLELFMGAHHRQEMQRDPGECRGLIMSLETGTSSLSQGWKEPGVREVP